MGVNKKNPAKTALKPGALKRARQKLGWTVAQAAKAVGVSAGSFSEWENGKHYPSWEGVQKLLTVFGPDILRQPTQTSRPTVGPRGLVLSREALDHRQTAGLLVVSAGMGGENTPLFQQAGAAADRENQALTDMASAWARLATMVPGVPLDIQAAWGGTGQEQEVVRQLVALVRAAWTAGQAQGVQEILATLAATLVTPQDQDVDTSDWEVVE